MKPTILIIDDDTSLRRVLEYNLQEAGYSVAAAAGNIDLLMIGDIGLRALSGVLADFRAVAGRDVNPHLFAQAEFLKRKNEAEHFIACVITSPKLFVQGTGHDLEEMGAVS